MQIPSGGPVPNGQTGSGSWNPTRQQLDQLETILQKMINHSAPPEQSAGQSPSHAPYWAGAPTNNASTMNQWAPAQNPGPPSTNNPQPFQPPKTPEPTTTLSGGGWNPSQTTWGPLADTWRSQQAPFGQPVSTNPGWMSQETSNQTKQSPTSIPLAPFPGPKSSVSEIEEYGETGISWLLNAIIDLPLRFMGPPGRFFMSWGGRYLLGFLGITMILYSGILVASDWMEWPWADRLIPSNLIPNFVQKAG